MNKSDLVDAVASSADLTKASAARAVDATLDAIGGALGNGDSVSLLVLVLFLSDTELQEMVETLKLVKLLICTMNALHANNLTRLHSTKL